MAARCATPRAGHTGVGRDLQSLWTVVNGRRSTQASAARCLAVVASLMMLCSLLPAVTRAAGGDERSCTYKTSQSPNSKPVNPTAKLSPDLPTQFVNFGGGRGWKFVDVVLNATPALPASVGAGDIRLEVLRRFTRISPTLPTRYAPTPAFTPPVISPGRDRITFTICLDGDGLAPGMYAGNVLVEGLTGLAPANVGVTENLKDSGLALRLACASLVAALAFLVLRGAAERQAKAADKHAQALTSTANAQQETKDMARDQAPPPKEHLRNYFLEVLRDLNWWLTAFVSLGVAAGSIIALYSANPVWGADLWASVAAIVSPTFAAVGVQSVITSLGKSV